VRKADHNRTAAEAIADEAVRAAEELRGHKPPGQGWGAGPELGRRGGGSEKGGGSRGGSVVRRHGCGWRRYVTQSREELDQMPPRSVRLGANARGA
jgi:hypothetical protein